MPCKRVSKKLPFTARPIENLTRCAVRIVGCVTIQKRLSASLRYSTYQQLKRAAQQPERPRTHTECRAPRREIIVGNRVEKGNPDVGDEKRIRKGCALSALIVPHHICWRGGVEGCAAAVQGPNPGRSLIELSLHTQTHTCVGIEESFFGWDRCSPSSLV